jgi:hypothetical protein
MSEIVDKEKLKIDAGLQYLPTDLTYELRMAVTGHQKDEFLSWGYHWEDKPHRLVYAACREVEAQAVTITRLTAEVEQNAIDLEEYRRDVERLRAALCVCELELNAYYRMQNPGDHPYSQQELDQAMASNPATVALKETSND